MKNYTIQPFSKSLEFSPPLRLYPGKMINIKDILQFNTKNVGFTSLSLMHVLINFVVMRFVNVVRERSAGSKNRPSSPHKILV